MDINEIKEISKLIEKYFEIANEPSNENNIEIKNNCIYLIKDNKVILKNELNFDNIKSNLEKTVYQKNVFKRDDIIFSPLEADRDEYKFVWKKNYNHINFPKFIPILLFSLLYCGKIPSIIDFCKIYMITYTEPINQNLMTDKRLYLYNGIYCNDRERLGLKIIFSDGQEMNNKLIKFKDKYLKYVKGIPINEFTTEHICSRIYKVYGSVVRDIYNVLYFNQFNVDTYYSLVDDLMGIDLIINNVPVFAYTNTFAGQEFRIKKINERHPGLNIDKGIELEKNVYSERVGGVYLINEKIVSKIIDLINNGSLNGILKISF